MLTGKMVRVRYARDRILPCFLDTADPAWLEVAGRMLEIFRAPAGRTRGEMEQELQEAFGDEARQLVHQGLAKLLEDRCDFEVAGAHPPAPLRAAVFAAAARARRQPASVGGAFDREAVLQQVARELGLTPEAVEEGLFADLKSQQRLARFEDLTPRRLLERYNVGLAQAVLLRSSRVHVTLRQEPPSRYRSLLRAAKFHRLICEIERLDSQSYRLHLDGPLSLFSATQKYGLQLALFLPTVLHCRDWLLEAELRWGAQRKPKQLRLGPRDGLVSHTADTGVWVAPEVRMFADLFRKRVADWELIEETDIFPLGESFWVPDFRLRHRASGQVIRLEVLGFWRRASAERHLARLRQHAAEPFLLAVSEQLHLDEAGLDDLPAGIHRFRNMPLPDELARLANELLKPRPAELRDPT